MAIKNTAAINISPEMFLWTYVSISLEIPRSEIAGSKWITDLNVKPKPTKLLQQRFPIELSVMMKMFYYPVTFNIMASSHMWLLHA